MPWMKRVRRAVQKALAMGLAGCIAVLLLPMGCASSIEQAPIRYRERNQDAEHFLPDITVERFQECLETHGDELGQLEPSFAHAQGHVQVSPEGRVLDVEVTGIPDRARELATCTRLALREMNVPSSVLSLRRKKAEDSTDEPKVQRGNELGNPIVLWEIGVVLAEFLAANGGRIVLYSVTIEVVGAGAVVGAKELIKRRKGRGPKDKCRDEYEKCMDTNLGDESGNNWNQSRCGLCLDWCRRDKNGAWPSKTDTVSCEYWKRDWPN